ncbi:hypothetical protein SEA_PHARAOH_45 [Mycobacterium phage Pharaoh]|uniref:Uncharacterized protein n=1 Tax=Mycobacterium phage Pharaoh TaxID=2530140 RepID=A0A481W263_9CAUD|nr:ribonucleoside reductase class II [Mycobacterium phage Pharaoh]QBJ00234.1 hypothetical protein SEA_PHARAOH_45 [Mycobacterium phage Pharaoh]
MSYEDPFADAAPAATAPEEAQQQPVAQAPAQTAPAATGTAQQIQHSTDGISATFKFDGAYGAPWVVVKGATASEVNAKIHDPEFKELMDYVKRIASVYGAPAAAPAAGGGQAAAPAQQAQRAPQGATQAPNGETRSCVHGPMVFKSGVSQKGNAYKLFSCTAPRDQQCKAEYLR